MKMPFPSSSEMQQWLLLLLLAGVAALASLLWDYSRRRGKKRLRLPPGPRGLPLLGNLGIFKSSAGRLRHQELDRLSKQYGPIMSLRLGSKPAIVISSPEVSKEVLKEHDQEFASRPKTTAACTLSFGNDSIPFCPYGPHLRFMRKIFTQEILSLKRVEQFASVRAEETSWMMRSILRASESGPGFPLDMNQRSSYLVINIITRILMNKRICDDEQNSKGSQVNSEKVVASEFKEMIDEMLFLAGVPIIGDFIPALSFLDRFNNNKAEMARAHEQFDTFAGRVLEEHRRQHQLCDGQQVEEDIVDILLSLPGEDGAKRLDDNLIKGLLLTALNAGTDTSSTTVEWALAELLRHPRVMKRVQEELDSVVGKERAVVEADHPHLPYLQAVVKEVFRLHPVVPLLLPHQSTQACQIAGFDIPAGTITFVNVWSISRNGDLWQKPLEFLPERFIDKDTDVRGKHFELLTFGTGRRGCPGIHLAIAVVHQTLARLVQGFDWSLPPGLAPDDLDMREKFGLTLPRATPLLAVPKARLPRHLY